MLTTLLPIDSGQATVAGFDVARQPGQVRTRIGYVSQLGLLLIIISRAEGTPPCTAPMGSRPQPR